MRTLLLRYVKRLARKQRHQGFFESLHRLALRGMNIGGGTDFETSGELHVLADVAASPQPWVVFDVGANRGGYAHAARDVLGPRARIVCFEPSPTAFLKLKTGAEANHLEVHCVALGSQPGTAPLYADARGSELGSLYQRELKHHDLNFQTEETVEVIRLDEFCSTHNIPFLSLLKLDAEGHELAVLQGAGDMLANGRIHCIQFEFGGCHIDARVFFRDFYDLLSPHYRLFRITKTGLRAVEHYDEAREQFSITNYFAKIITPLSRG